MNKLKLLTMLAALTSGLLTACVTELGDEDALDETSSSVLGVEPDEIDNACDPTTTTPDDIKAGDRDTRGVEPEEIDVRCTDEPTAPPPPIKYSPVITIKPKG